MPPRATKAAEAAAIRPNTLVIDNGAYSIKAGLVAASPSLEDCHIVPNCIARDQDRKIYVGSQLDQCKDYFGLVMRRPVEKGMVVNWEQERAIWHETFLSEHNARIKCDPHETNLILAEAPNVFPDLQKNCDQIVFEEFEFASYYRCIGPSLNAYGSAIEEHPPQNPAEYMLVVDSGFSHTTVTPLIHGRPVQSAIRRLNIGGKHLTNHLADLLAIHEISLKEEPWIANEVKEACCYVTETFKPDMEKTWRAHKMDPTVVVDCQLPDYQEVSKVIVKPYQAKDALYKSKSSVATLGNERFQIPEVLFNPGDIGMVEVGLPNLIMQSIGQLPEGLHPSMLANILLVGGNVLIPGFTKRLGTEMRQLAPTTMEVNIVAAKDPLKSTWWGGACLASRPANLKKHLITREQYIEHGLDGLKRRFQGLDS